MGVDITLGVIVLLCAVRGWLKGFLRQAIPLAALVACVYLADPLRDLARPHAAKTFPSIGPEVMNRLLWWSCASISYVLISGIGISIVKSMKKRTYGDPEPNRADQGAGFSLGVVKGLILASFMAWGFSASRAAPLASAPWVERQAQESKALVWAERYQPAPTLWASVPVQSFVNRVKSRGFWPRAEQPPGQEAEPSRVETAAPDPAVQAPTRTAQARPRTLSIPRLDPDSPDFLQQMADVMRSEGLQPE